MAKLKFNSNIVKIQIFKFYMVRIKEGGKSANTTAITACRIFRNI